MSDHHRWLVTIAAAALAPMNGVTAVSTRKSHSSIGATSIVGKELLSLGASAHNSEERGGRRFLEEEDDDVSYLASYSLKFQGCNAISQWGGDDGGDGGAKVVTKRIARLRLCPSDYCSDDVEEGCSEGYGEYAVDLGTYMNAWMQWIQQQDEDGGNDDGGDFDPAEYVECAAFGDYYVGPSCVEEGDGVGFGVYTEETCSVSAGVDFYDVTGYALPYSNGLVPSTCVSCLDADDDNQDDGDVAVNEMCGQVNDVSGKCETLMDISYPNENGCDYIAGLKAEAAGSDGSGGVSAGLIAFIVVFGLLSTALGVYVCSLKKKLDRKNVELSDGVGGLGSNGLL